MTEKQKFAPLVEWIADEVAQRIKGEQQNETTSNLPEWVTTKEAKNLLRIKDDLTLSKYVRLGKIAPPKTDRKPYLYSRASILNYLENGK